MPHSRCRFRRPKHQCQKIGPISCAWWIQIWPRWGHKSHGLKDNGLPGNQRILFWRWKLEFKVTCFQLLKVEGYWKLETESLWLSSPEEGNASSSEKVNKLNQASWFWLLLPLSYFPLDEPQDVMKPLWYVRSQFFVSQHVFQSWHINVFWQTFELLPLWCDDPQPPLAGHQVVVQRLQQWCAEAAAQFAERSLEEELQVKPKALLKRFFWGMEELDVAETLCWELLYIYILFFLFVFLVDVKLWMCWTSRDYIVGLEHCRLNVGGYHHFAYCKCIDETQIRVTPWCWSLTCVTREFPQGSTGYGGGHKNSTRQMVRLQSHGFGHGLWC